ncbi:MAG: thioredoxin family protein [Minisyncoccia bacterium]
MNKNIGIIIGIPVIVVIGFFAFAGPKGVSKDVGVDIQKDYVVNEVTNTMPVLGSDTPEMVVETKPVSAGSYEAYSAEKIANAETGDVVLFFHATWCPSCKALNGDIEKNVSTIPTGVTILKTDYDKEVALKKKYGVTYQHTLVQVDKDGNMIKKWSGGSKLENLLSQIQ